MNVHNYVYGFYLDDLIPSKFEIFLRNDVKTGSGAPFMVSPLFMATFLGMKEPERDS
jgi:hypothetical protein